MALLKNLLRFALTLSLSMSSVLWALTEGPLLSMLVIGMVNSMFDDSLGRSVVIATAIEEL